MTYYAGFHIDKHNRIYKNGKQVFTANHQYCSNEQETKDMIDRSNAGKVAQIRNRPSLDRPLRTLCELENSSEAAERMTNWINNEAEKQLNYDY